MLRLSLIRCFLVALFLYLLMANVPAQEPSMIPPPIPDFLPPPPPDPDTLPPPEPLDWQPLVPKDSGGPTDPLPTLAVPMPEVETPVAPPPPPTVETFVPGMPDATEAEKNKPDVKVWREVSEWPQIPQRYPNRLKRAYITGTEPVLLRVQFDPLSAGKNVYVIPGRGVILQPPHPVLTIAANGECTVSAQLDVNFSESHIILYCGGVGTVLPVWRASLQKVEAEEASTGGGQ